MAASMNRRRFIGTTGAGFAAAMLTGGALPGGLGKVVMAQDGGKEFHGAYPYTDPGAGGHFNYFVTNAILPPPATVYGEIVNVPLGMYFWATNSWLPLVAESWEFVSGGGSATPGASPMAAESAASPAAMSASPVADAQGIAPLENAPLDADSLVVHLRQGLTWSDGSPITAQDCVDTMWCHRIMSNTVWQYVDDAQVVDDHTFTVHMSVPSTVVERYVIRNMVPLPSSSFGEWAQQARDVFGAGKTIDDPEGAQLLDQFNNFRPEGLPANSGPYSIDVASITNAQMTLAKNENSYWADQVPFDRIINFNGETDTITAVVLSKEIDYATHGFSVATENQMIESGIRVLRPPTYSGPGLLFNYGKLTEFQDPKARQALAHAINREQNGTIALGESGVPAQYMAGFADSLVEQWLSEDEMATLNSYEYDVEKATSLFEELGWSKDGDVWMKPDGSEATYELSFPAEFADWSAAGQDLAEQLTDFGLVIDPRAITFTQQPIDVDQGNFDFAIRGWGNSTNPHPHFSFTTAFFTHNTLAVNNGGTGTAFPLQASSEVAGDVDLNAMVVASARGMSLDEQKSQVAVMAQVYNELLPAIPLWERFGNNCALEGVRVEKWPEDDDPLLKQSFYADNIPAMMMFQGLMEAV
jgi:peptide/nickel transport system substrate-binding protein